MYKFDIDTFIISDLDYVNLTPKDVWVMIFERCDPCTILGSVLLVCKRFFNISKEVHNFKMKHIRGWQFSVRDDVITILENDEGIDAHIPELIGTVDEVYWIETFAMESGKADGWCILGKSYSKGLGTVYFLLECRITFHAISHAPFVKPTLYWKETTRLLFNDIPSRIKHNVKKHFTAVDPRFPKIIKF